MRVVDGQPHLLPDEVENMVDELDEAVEIAKKYEEPEIAKFINGILGSFLRGEVK